MNKIIPSFGQVLLASTWRWRACRPWLQTPISLQYPVHFWRLNRWRLSASVSKNI